MWQCPKSGLEFKNANQDHFCSKLNSIDEYVATQPDDVRPLLHGIRETARAAAPEVTEKISWQMPTFWQGGEAHSFRRIQKTHRAVFWW